MKINQRYIPWLPTAGSVTLSCRNTPAPQGAPILICSHSNHLVDVEVLIENLLSLAIVWPKNEKWKPLRSYNLKKVTGPYLNLWQSDCCQTGSCAGRVTAGMKTVTMITTAPQYRPVITPPLQNCGEISNFCPYRRNIYHLVWTKWSFIALTIVMSKIVLHSLSPHKLGRALFSNKLSNITTHPPQPTITHHQSIRLERQYKVKAILS